MAAGIGLIALLFFAFGLVNGQRGEVVGVYDDTITVLTVKKKELRIRFAGVGTPELN